MNTEISGKILNEKKLAKLFSGKKKKYMLQQGPFDNDLNKKASQSPPTIFQLLLRRGIP